MSIAKALQPTDLPATGILEIEIEDPESVAIRTDGVEIILEDEPVTSEDFNANLAEFLDDQVLSTIASDLMESVESDVNARKDWSDMFVKGLEVLGMKYEERTEPWVGACGVYSPLLTEAAIRFQSEMIVETFPAQGPVKTQIIGEETAENKEAAVRVRDDMNWRLTEQMIEYRPEHERLLYNLGLSGATFKKIYYDPALGRQTALMIPGEDVVMPYGASNIYTAERVAHFMRKTKNDIRKLQESGVYCNIELGEPIHFFTDIEKKKAEEGGYTLNSDDRYQIIEYHIDYNIPTLDDEDGVAKPYVITIERGTQKVLSIYRNWLEDDDLKRKRQHFVQYTYVPGFGAYGLGYIHLIGGYARAGTSIIRQLVDAGTLSNLPGGLKARGMRIKGDDSPISPGEWRDVDIPSGSLRENFFALPYKEPSATLSALLSKITEDGRRLAGIAELEVSDMSAQAPVGTTLALLERQLKTMSAVQARVHASLRMEFKLLKQIIRDYMPEEYDYVPIGGNRRAKQEDYDLVEVIPVSDPNAATMAQRIMQYQAALQLAQGAPQIYDLPQLHRQMLEVLGIKEAAKLIPTAEEQKPRDPVSENMGVLTGKPLKAFMFQDHDAHIAVHISMLQDPSIMQFMGQSPMAAQFQGALMSHIAEHMGFKYRADVEQQLGVQLTAPDVDLDPNTEVQISRLVAKAAAQLLATNQAKAQQQQQQQQEQKEGQDPKIQVQMKDLEIKQARLQLDQQRLEQEMQMKARELDLNQTEIAIDAQKEAAKINLKDREVDKKLKVELMKTMSKPS
jgi:hypothetical protein